LQTNFFFFIQAIQASSVVERSTGWAKLFVEHSTAKLDTNCQNRKVRENKLGRIKATRASQRKYFQRIHDTYFGMRRLSSLQDSFEYAWEYSLQKKGWMYTYIHIEGFRFIELKLNSGWPDWANFRLLSDCLLWEFFKVHTEEAQIFCVGTHSYDKCYVWFFLQKMVWATFWAIFYKLIWSPSLN
jgi:hypothetical protein